MSHELTVREDGFVEMAYMGETPWHSLGNVWSADMSFEERCRLCGFDWEAIRTRVAYMHPTKGQLFFPDKYVLSRSDNGYGLGIVGKDFVEDGVQPEDGLRFFEDMSDAGDFTIETAGTMFGGKKFWAMARVGPNAKVGKGDEIAPYVTFYSGLDGQTATQVYLTAVRPVCWNTVSAGLRGATSKVVIKHSKTFDADAVRAQLGVVRSQFGEFMSHAKELAKCKVDDDMVIKLTSDLLIEDAKSSAKDVLDTAQAKRILMLYAGDGKGSDLSTADGTAWGWVNAVTEYVDHWAKSATADLRMASTMFGKGNTLKQAALDRALELVK